MALFVTLALFSFASSISQGLLDERGLLFPEANFSSGLPDFVIVQELFEDTAMRTEYFPPGDCQINEGCVGGSGERTVFRFVTGVGNIGTATWNVGDPAYSDLAVWDNCHDHYHVDNWMEYGMYIFP